jgi:hypothetical protein
VLCRLGPCAALNGREEPLTVPCAKYILLHHASTTVFLELPVSVVQWADLSSFQPTRDAMKVKRMLDGSRVSLPAGKKREVG